MKIMNISVLIIALLFVHQSSAKERVSDRSSLFRIGVRDGFVDAYVVNSGVTDLDSSYRPSISGIGYALNFYFFTKEGFCRGCVYSSPGSGFDQRGVIYGRSGDILPGEIVGVAIPVWMIADSYGLNDGCYGFYAAYTRREGARVVSRSISNATTVCIKNDARK